MGKEKKGSSILRCMSYLDGGIDKFPAGDGWFD